MTLEESIATRVAGISFDDLRDDDLLHTLKRNILDSYGGICGSLKDAGMLANFDRLASDPATGDEVSVWGIDARAGLADAVFMNTILGRRSDLLDTYISPNGMGGSHPSDNVALALTLAEPLAMDGRDLLTSIYVAFTLSAAFATYYDPEPANYDHDAAATFYTALVIGHAAGLDEGQLTAVQRIAGMLGLDTNQAAVGQVTDWKHCTYASCAMRAVHAVRIARAGFEAPPGIYRGDAGADRFFPHADEFFEPPPDLDRIIFKRWPALVFCQTPIDVALDLAAEIDDPGAIETIAVSTYEVAARNGATDEAYRPDSRAGRTHSIPYCVATALLKPIAYEDFDEPRAGDPDLRALIEKTAVAVDPALDEAYPAQAPCRIEITLGDGSTLERSREVPKGDPGDPLSDSELEDKLRQYFDFVDDGEREQVIAGLWELEGRRDTGWLLEPLNRRRL